MQCGVPSLQDVRPAQHTRLGGAACSLPIIARQASQCPPRGHPGTASVKRAATLAARVRTGAVPAPPRAVRGRGRAQRDRRRQRRRRRERDGPGQALTLALAMALAMALALALALAARRMRVLLRRRGPHAHPRPWSRLHRSRRVRRLLRQRRLPVVRLRGAVQRAHVRLVRRQVGWVAAGRRRRRRRGLGAPADGRGGHRRVGKPQWAPGRGRAWEG